MRIFIRLAGIAFVVGIGAVGAVQTSPMKAPAAWADGQTIGSGPVATPQPMRRPAYGSPDVASPAAPAMSVPMRAPVTDLPNDGMSGPSSGSLQPIAQPMSSAL